MLFNTPQFFVFLAAVLALFYVSPRGARKPLLLVASYFFYMCWNPKFIVLLAGLTIIDYVAAQWIGRTRDQSGRRAALLVSLAANLGLLGFFKYYNFFAANLAHLIGKPDSAFAFSIILPLGISFHTFQSISYVVDVYRGEQHPIRNFFDYALFISFFPQLVAGPIVRAREFFADLDVWRAPTSNEIRAGVLLLLLGLAKKVALADQFALASDEYFNHLTAHPGAAAAWTGMLAFGMQIFFDFSGYTDMAIGMAALFGFHFPMNFRRPYLALSITDFWRRWHMSLSRWLRDYLYIPLGGSRGGTWKTYRNLILTMLLGGLWHGASWNFVIWGGYHGCLLAAERAAGRARNLLAFPLVLVGWVFFRAATLGDSGYVLGQAFGNWKGITVLHTWHFAAIVVTALVALAEERRSIFNRIATGPAWAYGVAGAVLLLFVEMVGYTERAVPFVYFQF